MDEADGRWRAARRSRRPLQGRPLARRAAGGAAVALDPLGSLWASLQRHMSHSRLAQLEAEGPDCAEALYLHHLVQVAQGTGLDVTGLLPWSAPPSWSRQIQPYYRVLWAERERADAPRPAPLSEALPEALPAARGADASPHSDSSTASGGGPAAVGALVMRAVDGAAEDDEWLAEWFDETRRAAGGGRRLDQREQALLRRVHGRGFPEARIHSGAPAAELAGAVGARAFTVGRDIYLPGGLSVDSAEGAELLAHEATHVAQHSEGRLPGASGPGLDISSPADGHEREAHERGLEGRRLVGDPWGLAGLAPPSMGGQALLLRLAEALPEADAEPPEQVLMDALDLALRRRAAGARQARFVESFSPRGEPSAGPAGAGPDRAALLEGPLTEENLPDRLEALGAPGPDELESVQADFAPYPLLAERLGGWLSTLQAPPRAEPAQGPPGQDGAVMRWFGHKRLMGGPQGKYTPADRAIEKQGVFIRRTNQTKNSQIKERGSLGGDVFLFYNFPRGATAADVNLEGNAGAHLLALKKSILKLRRQITGAPSPENSYDLGEVNRCAPKVVGQIKLVGCTDGVGGYGEGKNDAGLRQSRADVVRTYLSNLLKNQKLTEHVTIELAKGDGYYLTPHGGLTPKERAMNRSVLVWVLPMTRPVDEALPKRDEVMEIMKRSARRVPGGARALAIKYVEQIAAGKDDEYIGYATLRARHEGYFAEVSRLTREMKGWPIEQVRQAARALKVDDSPIKGWAWTRFERLALCCRVAAAQVDHDSQKLGAIKPQHARLRFAEMVRDGCREEGAVASSLSYFMSDVIRARDFVDPTKGGDVTSDLARGLLGVFGGLGALDDNIRRRFRAWMISKKRSGGLYSVILK